MTGPLSAGIARAKAQIKSGTREGLLVAAEHLRGVSVNLAPIEEGTLRGSAVASINEAGDTSAVSYDTPYAVVQHERLDYAHPRGGQAKYLEKPMNSEHDTISALIAGRIRTKL